MVSTVAEWSSLPSLPLASIPPRMLRIVSATPSSAVMMVGVSSSSSSRTFESRFSEAWATVSSLEKPRNPQAPFTRVDATKDAGQELGRVRILLERHELAIEHIEVLVRLDRGIP